MTVLKLYSRKFYFKSYSLRMKQNKLCQKFKRIIVLMEIWYDDAGSCSHRQFLDLKGT